jgi:hypothetical protein
LPFGGYAAGKNLVRGAIGVNGCIGGRYTSVNAALVRSNWTLLQSALFSAECDRSWVLFYGRLRNATLSGRRSASFHPGDRMAVWAKMPGGFHGAFITPLTIALDMVLHPSSPLRRAGYLPLTYILMDFWPSIK